MGKRKRLPAKEIAEAYEEGDSIADLSRRYGVVPMTIRRRLIEQGVEIRPPKFQQNMGLGPWLALIVIAIEPLGGVDTVFTFAEVKREIGADFAPARDSEFYGQNPQGRVTLERVARGRYRLMPEWQGRAQAWIDSGGALKMRRMHARRLQKKIEADLAKVESKAGPSPWRAVQRQFRRRRDLRRSQNGRVIIALQIAGRPLSAEEVHAAAAGKNGWSRANRLRAIRDGLVVYDPLGKTYDLPSRAAPLSIARSREEFILLTLASAGPMSMAAIAKALGVNRRRVKDSAMKRLRASGEVERTGPGRYEITEAGMSRVREIVARKVRDDG